MKLLIVFGLFCASCVPDPVFVAPIETDAPEGATAEPPANIQPEIVNTDSPSIERSSFLLLGRDWRAHREGTGRGYQTDVMVLVSVLETDPIQITSVQYPRNFYSSTSERWLFSVWKDEGWEGLHRYWQEAFGVSLQGIFLIDMDEFVQIVDDLGGDGEETLAFLRDNENNWGYGGYDHEERVFQVLRGLWNTGQTYFLENPIVAVNSVLGRWGGLYESDLSNVRQLIYVFDLGWQVRSSEYEMRFVQLEEPALRWDDVPGLNVPRGWIANTDLIEWHNCTLDWECEA